MGRGVRPDGDVEDPVAAPHEPSGRPRGRDPGPGPRRRSPASPGRTSRPSRPRRCSNGADGYGLIRARRSPIRPAWRSEAPGPMKAIRSVVPVKAATARPQAAPSASSPRASDAATTQSVSARSSSWRPAHAPSVVWMSRAMTTSRSRDGSKRLTTGSPSRAVARQWRWRTGSPGGVGANAGEAAGILGQPADACGACRPARGTPRTGGRRRSGVGRSGWSAGVRLSSATVSPKRSPAVRLNPSKR